VDGRHKAGGAQGVKFRRGEAALGADEEGGGLGGKGGGVGAFDGGGEGALWGPGGEDVEEGRERKNGWQIQAF